MRIGKTTILIKRLGLKLDSQYLEVEEKRIVNRPGGEAIRYAVEQLRTPKALGAYLEVGISASNRYRA
jgi:hypothetical protein